MKNSLKSIKFYFFKQHQEALYYKICRELIKNSTYRGSMFCSITIRKKGKTAHVWEKLIQLES